MARLIPLSEARRLGLVGASAPTPFRQAPPVGRRIPLSEAVRLGLVGGQTRPRTSLARFGASPTGSPTLSLLSDVARAGSLAGTARSVGQLAAGPPQAGVAPVPSGVDTALDLVSGISSAASIPLALTAPGLSTPRRALGVAQGATGLATAGSRLFPETASDFLGPTSGPASTALRTAGDVLGIGSGALDIAEGNVGRGALGIGTSGLNLAARVAPALAPAATAASFVAAPLAIPWQLFGLPSPWQGGGFFGLSRRKDPSREANEWDIASNVLSYAAKDQNPGLQPLDQTAVIDTPFGRTRAADYPANVIGQKPGTPLTPAVRAYVENLLGSPIPQTSNTPEWGTWVNAVYQPWLLKSPSYLAGLRAQGLDEFGNPTPETLAAQQAAYQSAGGA